MEPTKIPCLAEEISAGLWVDLEEAWALAAGSLPAPTCKRGLELVVLLQLLLFFPVRFRLIGGLLLILRFGLCLTVAGGLLELLSLCSVLPFGFLLGCLRLIRVEVSSQSKFEGFARFMMSVFSLCLARMLCS